MSIQQSILASYGGATATPTAPPLTDVNNFYSLWNFDNGGAPEGFGIEGDAENFPFGADSPYPLVWATGADQGVATWLKQGESTRDLAQSTAGQRPQLDVTNHEIDFAGTDDCFVANPLTFAKQLSGCLLFKAGSLVETSVVFEIGATGTAVSGAISLRMVAGVLTFSVADDTPVVPLLNTKIKTISDSNYHVLTFVIDTQEATAANQVLIWVDGSQTGVTAPISSDLNDEDLLSDNLYVGARNQASVFFTGSMKTLGFFNTEWDTSTRQSFETFLTYLSTQ